MKNTVVHTIVLIALAALAVGVLQRAIYPGVHALAALTSNPISAISLFGSPLIAASKLVPGLALGWYTKRHPLLVGAIAGGAGMLVERAISPFYLEFYSQIGDIVAAAMIVSVAAFAGRALRHRLLPSNNSFKPKPLRGSA